MATWGESEGSIIIIGARSKCEVFNGKAKSVSFILHGDGSIRPNMGMGLDSGICVNYWSAVNG